MSRRGTLLPTHLCSAGGFGFACAVASVLRVDLAGQVPVGRDLPPGAGTVPSATFSSAAATPSFAAAADSSISRASAQAKRTAVPLSCTDWLPAVWPSFGVSAVSPWTIADALEVDVELVGGDLRERGADALAELDLAAEDRHRAVGVDAQPARSACGCC